MNCKGQLLSNNFERQLNYFCQNPISSPAEEGKATVQVAVAAKADPLYADGRGCAGADGGASLCGDKGVDLRSEICPETPRTCCPVPFAADLPDL